MSGPKRLVAPRGRRRGGVSRPWVEERVFQKLRVFAKHRRRSTETITGPHNEVEGEICAVFVIANLNGPRLRERP